MLPQPGGDAILKLDNVKVHYPIHKGLLRRVVGQVQAVDGVDLEVRPGETVGIVGESGSGKTSLARSILRVVDATEGEIVYRRSSGETVVINRADRQTLRAVRREIRMIFQDPHSSLDPRYTVRRIVGEPLEAYGVTAGAATTERVKDLLVDVGLRPEYVDRYPHMFSGGERQRIGIARALSLGPRLIVCDEAVSALDVSVQAQIINLLRDLQVKFGYTYLFVSHDLSVVRHISNRVAVMYCGRMVELAPTRTVYSRPLHPYTEALLSAVPIADPKARTRKRIALKGEVADPSNPPNGCRFHPRCRYATDRCRVEDPAFREIEPGRFSACHHAEALELSGPGVAGT